MRCLALCLTFTLLLGGIASDGSANGKSAYFGDLHIHTGLSLDAFAFGVVATPDDAIRFARGKPIEHVAGHRIQMQTPLDFVAITDHAEYLGVFAAMRDSSHPLSKTTLAQDLYSGDSGRVERGIARMKHSVFNNQPMSEFLTKEIIENMWTRSVTAAEHGNQPGEFTSFIAFEWSATPNAANLHRNVIFAGDREAVPPTPFSARDSQKPAALWDYLDQSRAKYGQVIAIPHNSNLSDGRMFPAYTNQGENSAQRARNEPLVEITQIKGSSETHPLLSPNDEWADFELLEELMGGGDKKGKLSGSYTRDALKQGLLFLQEGSANPYQFGFVGSSDSHNASSPVEENNYSGKIGRGDGTPQTRREGGSINSSNLHYSAAGLTGVWAEENTRASIFAALKRRETFATTGTRIQLRLDALQEGKDSIAMGGVFTSAGDKAPLLRARASMDANSASLQRLQIVKGWLRDGELMESITDIACGSGATPEASSGRCPEEDATVDMKSCKPESGAGAPQLSAHWQDTDFRPEEEAFYYLRALEHPSCRWSSWDSIRMGWDLPLKAPATIQERAWSSPIWYRPAIRKSS